MFRNLACLLFASCVTISGAVSASNLPCAQVTIPAMEQYPFHPGDWVSKVCQFAKENNLLAKGIDTIDQCIDATRCTMYPDATPAEWEKLSATVFQDGREYPIAVDPDAVDAFFNVASQPDSPPATTDAWRKNIEARMTLLENNFVALKQSARIDPSVQGRLLVLEAFKVATEKRLDRQELFLLVLHSEACRRSPSSEECTTPVDAPSS